MSVAQSPTLGQHFAFAQGRIGVLKQMLLSQSDVDRMLGAHDKQAIEQIFTELKITNSIDQGLQSGERIINAVSQWMRSEVESMTPDSKQDIFHILWLAGDAPVLAYALKKHHGFVSENSEEPTSGFSAYNYTQLHALVERDETSNVPSQLVRLVQDVKAMTDASPKRIDTAVAQYIANERLRLAKASGSKDIVLYVKHVIDVSNIRTALRLKDYAADECVPFLLHGGTMNIQDLAQSTDSIIKAIQKSKLSFELSDLLQKKDVDMNAVEQALTHIVAEDISRMWNVPLSVEPLFAFAAITVMQLQIMRMILLGKRNELSPQDIKSALPPFISASHYLLS